MSIATLNSSDNSLAAAPYMYMDPGASQKSFITRGKVREAIPDAVASELTRTAVSLEYASLRYNGHCPLGMYVVPSIDNLLVWDGVFFVHRGYYMDSVLKFRVMFPAGYPERPPVVQFLSDVFHPLISPDNGFFNLAPRFRPWKPNEHHVFDVLHWVKAAFKKHALDALKEGDCLNKDAFRLYHDTTSSFAALATQSSLLSQSTSALYDRDHTSMTGKPRDGTHFDKLEDDELSALKCTLGLY